MSEGLAVAGFDWDEHNRDKIRRKHGLLPWQIEAFFGRPFKWFPDELHSTVEARFFSLGTDEGGKPMVVIFTFRDIAGRRLLRPISARRMHAKERNHHDQEPG